MKTPQYAQHTPRGQRVKIFCRTCRKRCWAEIPEGSVARDFSTTDKALKVVCLVCGDGATHFTPKDQDDSEDDA
jgi:hypothetical protein